MGKVIVFRRPFESGSAKTGLGRYADGVQRYIRDHPAEYIQMDLSMRKGVLKFVTNGLIRPFLHLSNVNDKDNIFHATDEFCGVMFPFIKGKKILTVHHVISDGEMKGIYNRAWFAITRYSLRKADVIISISDTTTNDLIRMGADKRKIVTIESSVEPIFRRTDAEKKRIIGCLGQLHPRKNMKDSILAFRDLAQMDGMDDYELHIVGKGPEEDSLKECARELGISEKVKFLKDLSEDELIGFYNSCSLIFNTSLHEGFGLVTLEAQACGTPVLHLAHAAIPEIVTKLSIPCNSPEDMAMKAFDLLNDEDKYNDLSKRSEEYVSGFNKEHCERYRSAIFGEDH